MSIYGGRRWASLRRFILDRDSWRCRTCGKAGRLEVDHREPVSTGGDVWNPENLQALCRGCHFAKTREELDQAKPKPLPQVEAWRREVQSLMETL